METLKKANMSLTHTYNQNLQMSKIKDEHVDGSSPTNKERQNPNLLMSMKNMDKTTDRDLNVSGIAEEKSLSLINSKDEKGLAKKYKIFPSNKEREFLNYYNQMEGIIKDKEIKYLRFPGKKLLTEDETAKILKDRHEEIDNATALKRKIDIERHHFELDPEKPIIDTETKYLLKPTFDLNNNDKFFKTRYYYNCFLKIMTKQLIQNRATARINKLKEMISENNIRSSNDWADFVKKDWNTYLLMDTENEDFTTKLRFIEPKSLVRPPVFLSNEYNMDSLKQNIHHENNVIFDDLKSYEEIERSDAEVIGYKGKLIT